jgi:hypothetical protein
MKRFNVELRKALSVLAHPSRQKALKVQIELNSLVLAGLSKLLNSLGFRSHSKCSKRTNVFRAADILAARSAGHFVENEVGKKGSGCPFSGPQGCKLISNNLTTPAACVKRIVSENASIAQLDKKLGVAARYLNQMVRLLGVKNV